MSRKNELYLKVYAITSVVLLLIAMFIKAVWHDAFPFEVFEFLTIKGSIPDVLVMSWPLFAIGIAVNLPAYYRRITGNYWDFQTEELHDRIIMAFRAGIFEELHFRWLLILIGIATAKITNFLFFGFLGFGISEWVYMNIAGQFANFITFGLMHHLLLGDYGWAVGAAILATNTKFRDGHAYQGLIGWGLSWFAGMYFTYLTFTYGLIAAMVVHTAFDLLVVGLGHIVENLNVRERLRSY